MDVNEFEIDGKVYVTAPDDGEFFCDGCSFDWGEGYCGAWSDEIPRCSKVSRMDGRDVIFVEKHP